ncbi:MAG: GNAT family N-acetyltransferase [Dehalococcoidia bacterium]|nr:GNAT family N-acetyltransferase [Dehalococcoidia bacterium]
MPDSPDRTGPAPSATRVRWARPEDAETIVDFVRGLAVFEHEPPERVHLTPEVVLRDGFGPRPVFECVIAEQRGVPVGFALFFPNYSTWEGSAGLYLEDLYVDESARGTGAGRSLLAALARIARDRGWPRLDLSVLDWNPARAFYASLGMAHQSEWLAYRMEADAIARLASESAGIEGGRGD